MFLVDTNVLLELLLEQEKEREVRQFFQNALAHQLFITEFSLYSLGIVLFRLRRERAFSDFVSRCTG